MRLSFYNIARKTGKEVKSLVSQTNIQNICINSNREYKLPAFFCCVKQHIMYIAVPSCLDKWLHEVAYKFYKKTTFRDKGYKAIFKTLVGKYCRECTPFDQYVRMSGKYFKKAGCKNFHTYLKELIALGAVEVDHYYSIAQNIPKGYRLRGDLAEGSPILWKFKNKGEKLHDLKNPIIKKQISVLKQLRTTYTTKQEMQDILNKEVHLDYLKEDGLSVGFFPKGNHICTMYSPEARQYRKVHKFPMTTKSILDLAKETGLTTIYWKKKVHLVDNVELWIERKINEIKTYILDNLVRFRYISNPVNIIASINDTNTRFDTNITSTASIALKYVRLDGERLMSVDGKNFQLTLFSSLIKALISKEGKMYDIVKYSMNHMNNNSTRGICFSFLAEKDEKEREKLLKDIAWQLTENQVITEDFEPKQITDFTAFLGDKKMSVFSGILPFCELCDSGLFYEEMIKLMYDKRYKNYLSNAPTLDGVTGNEYKAMRRDVKGLTFKTIFPHWKASNQLKKSLKEHYPEAIDFITLFKKYFGSKNFSILLQIIEATIFVQDILKTLLDLRFKVFGKHDAILFKESDYIAVMEIVYNRLDVYLDGYKVSIEKI